ncbi:GAF domain-containing protein [Botrimarina sp.]|uniref:GAF domain-containing protein n=1 Tax=Botrimarina sp. TaxID=2795802 RepID=UPI0032EB2C78
MTEPLASLQSTDSQYAALPGGLSDRLAAAVRPVLRGAARGVMAESGGFAAAEFWLLDDATQNIQLAARWAKKNGPLAAGPATKHRRLADAPAEVAALAGGAVVLEERTDAIGWELPTPEPASAICVPVASDSKVYGVFWMMSPQPREIPDTAAELAEIIAGRLALEIERLGEAPAHAHGARFYQPGFGADAPTSDPLGGEPLVEGSQASCPAPVSASVAPVEAAAWAAPHCEGLSSAGCWELADGRLLSISVAAIDAPDSTTATQRCAVEWLLSEAPLAAMRSGDAGELLTRLNVALQASPLAGEGLAVAAALVERPEDSEAGLGGVGSYAVAGPAIALAVRAASTDAHSGELIPLGWLEPDAAYAPRAFELPVRGRLVLVAGDPRLTSPLAERRLGDIFRAATSDAHREMTAEGCLRRLASQGGDDVFAAVALRRE